MGSANLMFNRVKGDNVLETMTTPYSTGLILPFSSALQVPGCGYTLGDQLPPFYTNFGQTPTHLTALNPIWNTTGLDKVQTKLNDVSVSDVFNGKGRFNNVRA